MSAESGAALSDYAAAISAWIDSSSAYVGIDQEAHRWRRVAKVGEEAGEVISALIGTIGENPRKGKTHTDDDLIGELLDVAFCALAAVEHLTGNSGASEVLLLSKARKVCDRAGVAVCPHEQWYSAPGSSFWRCGACNAQKVVLKQERAT